MQQQQFDRRLLAAAAVAAIGLVTLAEPASAQGRARGRAAGVPPGHLPPPGECRVWYDGRPPGHQPAPTSCSAARALAARTGGRVIYGGARRSARDAGRDRSGRVRAKPYPSIPDLFRP